MWPNFFIVGAAKSGTTSMDRYLNQHPDIFMASRKETHFFAGNDMPDRFRGPGDEAFSDNLIRDEKQYLAMFDTVRGERVIGESSVYYLYYPTAAERIYDTSPNAKILIILRNPVDRAFSAYMHLVRDGRESLSFADALDAEASRKENFYQPLWYYREVGLYSSQVSRYLARFAPEQVKIVWYEEFDRDPGRVLREVFTFLEVNPDVRIDTGIRYNATGIPIGSLYHLATQSNRLTGLLKPLIPERIRQKLRHSAVSMSLQRTKPDDEIRRHLWTRLKDDVAMLEDLLHRSLTPWYC